MTDTFTPWPAPQADPVPVAAPKWYQQNRWRAVVAVLLVLGILGVALAFQDGSSSSTDLGAVQKKCTSPALVIPLAKATNTLVQWDDSDFADWVSGGVTYADGTLTLDGAGMQYEDTLLPNGAVALVEEQCVFDALGVPKPVQNHVGQTRALDGTQTDKWGSLQARWTYHPDDGLNMTIWSGS